MNNDKKLDSVKLTDEDLDNVVGGVRGYYDSNLVYSGGASASDLKTTGMDAKIEKNMLAGAGRRTSGVKKGSIATGADNDIMLC